MPINFFRIVGILLVFSLLSAGCTGQAHHVKRQPPPETKSRLKTQNALKPHRLQTQNIAIRAEPPDTGGTDTSPSSKTHGTTDPGLAPATTPQHPRPDLRLNKQYFYGLIPDTIKLVTSPLRWSTKDWFTAGLVTGATVGVGFLDGKIQAAFGNSPDEPHKARHDFLKVGKYFGDGGYAAGYLSLLYLAGMAREDDELKSTVLLAGESFLITGFFTEILKHMVGRGRPNNVEDSDDFDGPNFSFNKSLSFPSGHTATAFAIATVFARQYQRHVWVPPLLYSLATMTAVSRINDNVHWASDVLFGATVGYFTSSALYKMHLTGNPGQLGVRPLVGPSSAKGLAVDYRF